MYKFSKEAKELLLKDQFYAFLFVVFSFMPEKHPDPREGASTAP
jgi:hypothetical protein